MHGRTRRIEPPEESAAAVVSSSQRLVKTHCRNVRLALRHPRHRRRVLVQDTKKHTDPPRQLHTHRMGSRSAQVKFASRPEPLRSVDAVPFSREAPTGLLSSWSYRAQTLAPDLCNLRASSVSNVSKLEKVPLTGTLFGYIGTDQEGIEGPMRTVVGVGVVVGMLGPTTGGSDVVVVVGIVEVVVVEVVEVVVVEVVEVVEAGIVVTGAVVVGTTGTIVMGVVGVTTGAPVVVVRAEIDVEVVVAIVVVVAEGGSASGKVAACVQKFQSRSGNGVSPPAAMVNSGLPSRSASRARVLALITTLSRTGRKTPVSERPEVIEQTTIESPTTEVPATSGSSADSKATWTRTRVGESREAAFV